MEARTGYPDPERQARCDEQRAAEAARLREASKTPLDLALEVCRAKNDQACAQHLRDQEVWSSLLNSAAVLDTTAVLESACSGQHDGACRLLEQNAATNERVSSGNSVASKRMDAALNELGELEKQWVNQLTTLSQLKCATGEQAVIAEDWAKGAEGRVKRIAGLDAVAAEVGADAVWGEVWPPAREQFDLVIGAAERAAVACKLGS